MCAVTHSSENLRSSCASQHHQPCGIDAHSKFDFCIFYHSVLFVRVEIASQLSVLRCPSRKQRVAFRLKVASCFNVPLQYTGHHVEERDRWKCLEPLLLQGRWQQ